MFKLRFDAFIHTSIHCWYLFEILLIYRNGSNILFLSILGKINEPRKIYASIITYPTLHSLMHTIFTVFAFFYYYLNTIHFFHIIYLHMVYLT